MKTAVAVSLALLLLCGCSQEKSQVGSMIWPGDASNCTISVIVKGSVLSTNVTTLEQASDFLGNYGWQFASEADATGNREFYMKRQYRGNDTSEFALMPATSAAAK